MNIIMERYPYRYVEVGTLENGKPGVPCYVKDEAEAPDTDEGGRYKL